MERFYYNDGEKISYEEAKELTDKSKLCSSDKEIKFKEIKKEKKKDGTR